MWSLSFGPTWFWILFAISGVFGFFSMMYHIVQGILWVFNHIAFV